MILDKNKLIYIINQIFFEKYWCTEKYYKIVLVVNGCVIKGEKLVAYMALSVRICVV